MKSLIAALFTLACHLTLSAAPVELALLPFAKPVEARVMQLGSSREYLDIVTRVQAAMARQPEWTRAYMARYQDHTGALPYHANLGVTRAEYDILLQPRQIKLMQTATVQLSAVRDAKGSITLRTVPAMQGIDGIVIDSAGKTVTTRLAQLTEVSQVNQRDADGATGRWTGTQWLHEAISEGRALNVRFALGLRGDQGDAILYLDVQDAGAGESGQWQEFLLFPPAE